MTKIQRNFIKGRMNKSLDERLLPDGEYIDALNVRLGSTEASEFGSVENSKGNTLLTVLQYLGGIQLSVNARCIGAYEDGANETIYWFVHDPAFTVGDTGRLDLIVSFNTVTTDLIYHVVSINEGNNINTTLNFSLSNLITGVNLVDDLLFFTDNYNPPRFINVKKNYPSPVNNLDDSYLYESLLVVKKPPLQSPSILPLKTDGDANFLEDRFLCFAYRYQYENGEYSAVSQFSDPAFIPKGFQFSSDSYLNVGMENSANAVKITFNSGSSLVKGVDLLYKEYDDATIKVIEKLDKENIGYADDTEYTYDFYNKKVFTVLPEYEILRTYDNVPRFAQAQTVMGNRLIYGNYVDGYDLVDRLNNPIKLGFSAYLFQETIGNSTLDTSTVNGVYDFGVSSQTIANSIINIDLTGKELKRGASITVEFSFLAVSSEITPPGSIGPDESTSLINTTFTYFIPTTYNSVYELATSSDFISKIGTVANIQTVANSCNGTTLTDIINCSIPNFLGTSPDEYYKYASGITAASEPISIFTDLGSDIIGLQIPAMQFVDDVLAPTISYYEYYEITSTNALYQEIANPYSLHSNRGYEIGMVYMDDFNRSSTALVGRYTENTVSVPCSASRFKNSIRVDIPSTQLAPSWATRYKFVIKPDLVDYETIYSNIFFPSPTDNSVYFLLEGENAAKIEAGDRLIVKTDTSGPTQQCSYATVLEKQAQSSNFIEVPVPGNPALNIDIPAGVYMKINPNSFNAVISSDSIIAKGRLHQVGDNGAPANERSHLPYPVSVEDTLNPGTYLPIAIPAGTRVTFNIRLSRRGQECFTGCEKRAYYLPDYDGIITVYSSQDYASFSDWFVGDNVERILDDGVTEVGCSNREPMANYFISTPIQNTSTPTSQSQWQAIMPGNSYDNYYQFYKNTATGEEFFVITGGQKCSTFGGDDERAYISAEISIYQSEGTITFETEPSEALPDVWYENDLSFPIDALGQHQGNINNQTSTRSAVVDTEFYNCISFGNGVESYKIRDSITGKRMNFGNRVTSTSAQDFKEAHRFADLTYSGVYNDETNVNKLNEFNLGLLNFKPLEDSFGPIQKLFTRQTDVLVLQEDKISYVLQGKDILTDASGGGTLTSVPEVLGQQVARTEEYGISNNPESFASWGYDKFFTDSKRGAVINLKGGSSQADQLNVISELGMRSWFRDFFINSIGTQKLGGFDPYMNEFVLSSTRQVDTVVSSCISCGISRNINLIPGRDTIYCVDVTQEIGDVVIDYIIPPAPEDNIITELTGENIITETGAEVISQTSLTGIGYSISIVYNGVTYTTGLVYSSGSITVPKESVDANEMTLIVSTTSASSDSIEITVNCPVLNILTLYNIAITSNNEAGQFIHNEYSWVDGTFQAPLHSNLVEFISGTTQPLVSQYDKVSGPIGAGVIPTEGAIVTMFSNKIAFDDFVFDTTTNNLRYLRSSTLYQNNPTDISNLLSAATTITPLNTSGAPDVYSAEFTMPAKPVGNQDNLYMIWDYRKSTSISLCYSDVDSWDSCCGCLPAIGCDIGRLNTSGGQGYYTANIETGGDTGAIILYLDPKSVPDGIRATYDGQVYNKLTSRVYGYLGSDNPNGYSVIGMTGASDCGLAANGFNGSLNEFAWDGSAFTQTGSQVTVNIATTDVNLTSGKPSYSCLVIPKPNPGPSTYTLETVGPCSNTAWDLILACPAKLVSYQSSTIAASSSEACSKLLDVNYYNVPADYINRESRKGIPKLYDFVFSDENAVNKLPAGWYKFRENRDNTNKAMQVDANGVIISIINC